MPAELEIILEEIEQRPILRLRGRLDTHSAPILERKLIHLIEDGTLLILLDFAGIDYLSSAALRVLLSASKKLAAEGGSLVLFSLSDEVKELLQMAGFEKIFHIFKNEQEALQFRL